VVHPSHDVLAEIGREFHGILGMMLHAPATITFWLALAGIATAVWLYLLRPDLPEVFRRRAGVLYTILDRKYGFDEAYQKLFGEGALLAGTGLWKGGDVGVIDGVFVNGSARVVGWFARLTRRIQTGYIYNYAFAMIFGILLLLTMIFVF
jgi:NADH-quinone oxidoreductase subunit L